jgi:hypothetical protein
MEELLLKNENDKMVVTRTLQQKYEEKKAKIAKYELRLQELEQSQGKT